MKKDFVWAVIISITLFLGISVFYLGVFYNTDSFSLEYNSKNIFSFYRSEMNVNGDLITEKLSFNPDTSYHTLFRNFVSDLGIDNSSDIILLNVSCSSGQAYFVGSSNISLFDDGFIRSEDIPYTENNEYGCTFGNEKGFEKGKNYFISAEYKLNPMNVVVKEDKKYIKFVVYSSKNHNALNVGDNFILSGDYFLDKDSFSYSEDVVLYLPVLENSTIPVFVEKKTSQNNFLFFIICFLPSVLFSLIWFFSREKSPSIGLDYSTTYPKERVGWQVASGFVAPFNSLGSNVFSSLFLELFNKKSIDIEIRNKKTFVLLKNPSKLDDVEKDFYTFLKSRKENSKEVDSKGYFSLEQKFSFSNDTRKLLISLKEKIDLFGKTIYNKTFLNFLFVFIILFFVSLFFTVNLNYPAFVSILLFLFYFICVILTGVVAFSGIAVVFKGNFYTEYTHWRAFRKFLISSDSIKNADERATILWEKYLVYAAALNVPKKVIEKWKDLGYVSTKSYNSYYVASFAGNSFVSSAGASGVSGGGVGGGGGGGR